MNARLFVVSLGAAAVAATPALAQEAPPPVKLTKRATKQLQAALHVTVDGAFGPQSRRALKRWERRNGFFPDGRPDQQDLDALGIDNTRASAAAPPSGDVAGTVVSAARRAVGSPYASAGTTPDGFDCSGLTMWAFKKAGIRLPHSSYDQYTMGDAVERSDVQAGDLVFFNTSGSGASHVGIAVSNSRAISATSHGVMEHSLNDDYWGGHYMGARRISG